MKNGWAFKRPGRIAYRGFQLRGGFMETDLALKRVQFHSVISAKTPSFSE